MTESSGGDSPKYLSFLSYKGGVGRSLAAVSAANLLAQCGKHVLLIDFDIESPGIPTFYGFDAFAGLRTSPTSQGALPSGRGVVHWLLDRFETEGEPQPGTVLGDVDQLSNSDLAELVGLPVDELDRHLLPMSSAGPGSLRVLPAGPVGTEYLSHLRSIEWRSWTRPTIIERYWVSALASQLRREISALRPQIDFVLVDGPAGMDPMSSRVIENFATHVAFFASNEPSEVAVAANLKETLGQLNLSRSPVGSLRLSLLPVLSRRPAGYQGDDRLEDAWLPLGKPAHIRHDHRHGLDLIPSIPLVGKIEARQLARDHIRFLDDLLRSKPVDLDTDRELAHSFQLGQELRSEQSELIYAIDTELQRREAQIEDQAEAGLIDRIRSELTSLTAVKKMVVEVLDSDEQDDFKIFEWFRGTIINVTDPVRAKNVSFRVESFRKILDEIWHSLDGTSTEERASAFERGGREAGLEYGRSLRHELFVMRSMSYESVIRTWCHEDSQVGFGELSLREGSNPNDRWGVIEVENPFLPPVPFPSDDPIGAPLIFKGYCQGVIQGLYEDPGEARIAEISVDVTYSTRKVTEEAVRESLALGLGLPDDPKFAIVKFGLGPETEVSC